ncbi:MAG: hypothetical protein J6J79_11370 [Lachnospiraceae bacterium]|nr:hypothetical protein [Lachnospiraceae bacterium]HCB96207.1 hypothetical protein [Ruminococcus sp.]
MSKNKNNISLYEQQEERIRVQSDAFITLLTERGILGDHRIDDERIRNARQTKQKNTYHNTLMLLKNYRTIAWMLECFPDNVAEELDRPFENLDELIDHIDVEMSMGNRKLESRIEGVRKSRILLDRVNEALTVLKKKPENGEILYNLIYQTFITPENLSLTDILYRLDISPRHYYRLRSQAITILSIRLWAAPAKDVDFWLEMLTLLEGLS